MFSKIEIKFNYLHQTHKLRGMDISPDFILDLILMKSLLLIIFINNCFFEKLPEGLLLSIIALNSFSFFVIFVLSVPSTNSLNNFISFFLLLILYSFLIFS